MREVFISYKSNDPSQGNNDETVANELCKALEDAGITCWIAPRDIEPGKRYARAIMDAVQSCNAMVVVFSRYVNDSEHIANEVDAAFARKIDIIPFNIDGAIPNSEFNYYLRRMQWINASVDFHQRIPELIAALRHKLQKRKNARLIKNIIKDASSEANIIPLPPEILNFTVNGVSFNLVRVEGGMFMMGSTPEQGDLVSPNERPVHKVTLSCYHIGETVVTQELWQAVMGVKQSQLEGDFKCPIERISWNDCQKFITRLNKMTGRRFRLPTEAEWEFAARGGNKSKGYKYAGSNHLDEVAWFRDNSGKQTHPVAAKKANELGLYDMNGNVWEWCQDWYEPYISDAQVDPIGPSSSFSRVSRGGSCKGNAWSCRVSFRNSGYPSHRLECFGLRLAL